MTITEVVDCLENRILRINYIPDGKVRVEKSHTYSYKYARDIEKELFGGESYLMGIERMTPLGGEK